MYEASQQRMAAGARKMVWRILRNLNNKLTAIVKTKHGPTREIDMEIGGRQGSRLTGRLFSKMMDVLAEELSLTDLGFEMAVNFIITTLLLRNTVKM